MTLPQIRPESAPSWAFWLETNALFGWVSSSEDWEIAKAALQGRAEPSRMRQAVVDHPMVVLSARAKDSYGTRREHCGPRTLADHAAEHGLDWLR